MLQSLNGVRVHKAPTAPHLTRRRPTLPLTRTFSFALDFLLEFYFILFYFIVDEVQNPQNDYYAPSNNNSNNTGANADANNNLGRLGRA